LKLVLVDKEITSTFSEEALATAKVFSRDFDRSGIHLPLEKREKFVALSSRIITLGNAFLTGIPSSRRLVKLNTSELQGFPRPSSWRRTATIQGDSPEAHAIMALVSSENVRQRVYEASHTGSEKQIRVLDDLLQSRADIARLVGYRSYAAMELEDKMAKSPGEALATVARHV
jgi:intermediate peptidase